MIKLYVVGYPLDIQESELIEIFSIHGMLHSIDLLKDKQTGRHKGFGFVEMVDQASAERVMVALNGMVLRGRKLSVKPADENRVRQPKVFKSNRFSGSESNDGADSFKSKRPRKLISNTFRAEK